MATGREHYIVKVWRIDIQKEGKIVLIKRFIKKIFFTLFLDFYRSSIYWKRRVKKLGAISVINSGHINSDLSDITEKQGKEIFPYFQGQLIGTEKTVLDFGCGVGRFTERLAAFIHGQAIGVDPIKNLIDLAPSYSSNVQYKLLENRNIIPLDDNTVDIVWCYAVLGGLIRKALLKSVDEICRVLQPGGLLFLIEATTEKSDGFHWSFRSINEYQAMFPLANLVHLHDFYDINERFSILAGRLKK